MTTNIISELIAKIEGYLQGVLGSDWLNLKPTILTFVAENTSLLLVIGKYTATGQITPAEAVLDLKEEVQTLLIQLQQIQVGIEEKGQTILNDIEQMALDALNLLVPKSA